MAGDAQDLSLPETLKAKHGQHQHLKAILEERDWTVHLVIIPISCTGMLVQPLTTALTKSGVTVSLTKSKLTHGLAYNNKIKVVHDSLRFCSRGSAICQHQLGGESSPSYCLTPMLSSA